MAEDFNKPYSKAGLDPVTDEEHEELTSVLSTLTDESCSETASIFSAAPKLGDVNSLDNVFYINFKPSSDKLAQPMLSKLNDLANNVALSHSFFSNKANQAVLQKIEQRQIDKNDTRGQANYKAKVINYLISNSPWIATNSVYARRKDFDVDRKNFHQELITECINGLDLPKQVVDKLEGLLDNIKGIIDSVVNNPRDVQFYINITLFVKDDMLQTFRPCIRTIFFTPNMDLVQYVKGKQNIQRVRVALEYVQTDGSFNNQLFEGSVKDPIKRSLEQAGVDFAKMEKGIEVAV